MLEAGLPRPLMSLMALLTASSRGLGCGWAWEWPGLLARAGAQQALATRRVKMGLNMVALVGARC